MSDQLSLAAMPVCRCVLRGGWTSAEHRPGWWHDRRCPAYTPPPAEMMRTAWCKGWLGWLYRHWPHKRYPRAADFQPARPAQQKRGNDEQRDK